MSEFYKEIIQITQDSTALERVRKAIKNAAKQGLWSVRLGRHNHDATPEVRQQLEKEGFGLSYMGDWGLEIRWKKEC